MEQKNQNEINNNEITKNDTTYNNINSEINNNEIAKKNDTKDNNINSKINNNNITKNDTKDNNINSKNISSVKYKLFFDIETNGLPKTKGFNNFYKPEFTKYYDSSRLIELAYIICDEEGNEIKREENLIKPNNNFTIENSSIHNITTIKAENEGKDINIILNDFYNDLKNVDTIISHNSLFDTNILLSECYRIKNKLIVDEINNKKIICTMELGKTKMKQKKYPKLVELYKFLFNKDFDQIHRALSDTIICKDCYYKMIINKDNNKDNKNSYGFNIKPKIFLYK